MHFQLSTIVTILVSQHCNCKSPTRSFLWGYPAAALEVLASSMEFYGTCWRAATRVVSKPSNWVIGECSRVAAPATLSDTPGRQEKCHRCGRDSNSKKNSTENAEVMDLYRGHFWNTGLWWLAWMIFLSCFFFEQQGVSYHGYGHG